MKSVTVRINDGIATIVLDHPPLNLLSNRVKAEITAAFHDVSLSKQTRVIFFHTAGKDFCCGADLKEFPERVHKKLAGDAWIAGHEMLQAILEAPQPTIACVKGNALGGGAELASSFDFRIFDSNARIGFPEVLRGVFPGNGGMERLIDLVGEAHAAPLLLVGDIIDAHEAFRIGLATKVVGEDKVFEYARNTAQLLAERPGIALHAIKQSVRKYRLDRRFFIEGKELFSLVHETEDVLEAVQAFLEKRDPVFRHC